MIFKNLDEKKRMTWIFAGFYTSAAMLLILIFTVFWDSRNGEGNGIAKNMRLSGNEQLTQMDNLLQDHLNGLQYLDKKFASLLIDSGMNANFDTTYNKIRNAESAFSNAIDSIDRITVNAKYLGKFNQIISSYKSALENRKPMDDMQQGVTLGCKQINNNQQALIKFKTDLLKKDSSIAELNEQLKPGSVDRYAVSFPNSDFKLLRNENKYLKSELKLMEARFGSQRNSKNSLTDENKTIVNVKLNEPAKSKIDRSKETGYENTKRQ